jgi:hypothetical protein
LKYTGQPLVVILESATATLRSGDVVDEEFEEYLKTFHVDSVVEEDLPKFEDDVLEHPEFFGDLKDTEFGLKQVKTDQQLLVSPELNEIRESLTALFTKTDELFEKLKDLEDLYQIIQSQHQPSWNKLNFSFFFGNENLFFVKDAVENFSPGDIFRFSVNGFDWSYGIVSHVHRRNLRTEITFVGSPFSNNVKYLEIGDSRLYMCYTDFVKKHEDFCFVWRGPKAKLIEVSLFSKTKGLLDVCGVEVIISGKPICLDSPTIDLTKTEKSSGTNINNENNMVVFGDEIVLKFVGDEWKFDSVKVNFSFVRI